MPQRQLNLLLKKLDVIEIPVVEHSDLVHIGMVTLLNRAPLLVPSIDTLLSRITVGAAVITISSMLPNTDSTQIVADMAKRANSEEWLEDLGLITSIRPKSHAHAYLAI